MPLSPDGAFAFFHVVRHPGEAVLYSDQGLAWHPQPRVGQPSRSRGSGPQGGQQSSVQEGHIQSSVYELVQSSNGRRWKRRKRRCCPDCPQLSIGPGDQHIIHSPGGCLPSAHLGSAWPWMAAGESVVRETGVVDSHRAQRHRLTSIRSITPLTVNFHV